MSRFYLPPRPLPASRDWIRYALAGTGLAVLVAGVATQALIERSALAASLSASTGFRVRLDGLRHESGRLVLNGFHARSRSGAIAIDATRIAVVKDESGLRLDVERPEVTFLTDRRAGGERGELEHAAEALKLFGTPMHARIHNGSAVLASGDVPEARAVFDGLRGTIEAGRGTPGYDLQFALVDGGERYPVAAWMHGGVTRWQAARLPLAPLAAPLEPAIALRASAGMLFDVNLAQEDGTPRLRATLAGGVLTFANGATHEVRDLSGDLAVQTDAFASPGLKGTLDGIPLEIAGEAHGLRDLRELSRLSVAAAERPAVTSIRLEATAPGVAYLQYGFTTEHGPVAVTAVLVDPREPTLRFDTAIAEDHVISGGERTSAMGVRTRAVAGVNGDYFDIGRSYAPQGMLIRGGEIVRGPTDRYALVIGRDNTVEFGEYRLKGAVRTARGSFPVTQVNSWPAGHATIITPSFGKTLPPAKNVTFIALDALAEPGRYRVAAVHRATTPIPVSFGLALGPLDRIPVPRPGDTLALTYALDPPVEHPVAAIGGGPLLLKDGAWFEDKHAPAPDERDVRWPVIALAKLHDDFLVMVAVDGRHPERSVGMTRPEFADLLRGFGATDAMALDSGGSVTLVARAPGDENVSVRNVPSDSSAERWVSDGLFLYSSAPPPAIVAPKTATTPVPEARPSP